VFAPTDAAFVATATALGYDGDTTDEAAVATWLVEALGAQLTPVLTYHVAAGTFTSTDVAAGPVTTLEGTTVSLEDLDIATADVAACNGIVHVLNNVLIPAQTAAALATIAETAVGSDDFNILVGLLGVADLVGAVADEDAELTVFAPTDAAFIATATALGFTGDTSDEAAVAAWLVAALGSELGNVLTYHVAAGTFTSTDVTANPVLTLEGSTVAVADLDIAAADLEVCNGIIHVINNVLVPNQTAAALAGSPAPTAVPAPTSAPVVVQPAPAPAPVVISPAPAPVVISPAPAPVVISPAPAPVISAAAPIVSAAAPADKKVEHAADDKKAEATKLAHTGSTTTTLALGAALLMILGGSLILTQRPAHRRKS